MTKNIVKEKSYSFALKTIEIYKYITINKKEFVLSKQLLRSGTSVGANIRESTHAESRPDFIHKFAIAQKEINESIYWIELLKDSKYITEKQFQSLYSDALDLIRIITSILKTSKRNNY